MSAIHCLFDIRSSPSTVAPPAATHQEKRTNALVPVELDKLTFGTRYNGPRENGPLAETESAPLSPSNLEMSRPPSPRQDEAVGLMQTWNNPPMNTWRILSCCLIYFGNGMNDSVTGALIPYIEVHYHIGYAVMSLVFVANAIGFISVAFVTNTVLNKLGRAKTLILAELILLVGYIMLVTTPPYPVVVLAFFFLGLGMGMNLALNNVFCANIHPPTTILGASHGSYGIGGIVAPIVATAMVSKGILWSRFYFISVGLRILCIPFAGWAFWTYHEDNSQQALLSTLERTASRQVAGEGEVSKLQNLKLALKNRVTLFGALFIFAYQGAEVSISGWVISFLINYRGGDPATVGYVTAGFWGGITLGRFCLTHVATRMGESLFIIIAIACSVVFQILAWQIPNVIGNAVAVAVLGLLLGPVYPCAQTIFSKLMPRHVQTTAIGFIAGAGSSGGAVAPFTTGILSQALGTFVLHPICIGLYVVMLGCWWGLPKIRKRTD